MSARMIMHGIVWKALTAAAVVSCIGSGTKAARQTQALPLVTWNVHLSIESTPREQVSLLMGLSPRPAVIALQEIKLNHEKVYEGLLRKATGEPWQGVFVRHCDVVDANGTCKAGFNNGLLTLTRHTVVSAETRFFKYPDKYVEWRGAIRTSIEVGGTLVHVFNVHLQTDTIARQRSIAELKRWMSEYPSPRLAGGDFNAPPDFPEINPPDGMRADTGGGYADAWALLRPDDPGYTFQTAKRVDYWFSDRRGRATPTSAYLPPAGSLSDHLPLFVTYEMARATNEKGRPGRTGSAQQRTLLVSSR